MIHLYVVGISSKFWVESLQSANALVRGWLILPPGHSKKYMSLLDMYKPPFSIISINHGLRLGFAVFAFLYGFCQQRFPPSKGWVAPVIPCVPLSPGNINQREQLLFLFRLHNDWFSVFVPWIQPSFFLSKIQEMREILPFFFTRCNHRRPGHSLSFTLRSSWLCPTSRWGNSKTYSTP